MEKEKITIRSYQYFQQNLAILLALIFGVPAAIFAIWQRPLKLAIVLSLGSISLAFLICAFVLRIGCRTYDIYDELGITRITKNKVVFQVKWTNIEAISYWTCFGIILLQPFVLNLFLIEPLKNNVFRNSDHDKLISSPMSKKYYKKILAFIPKEIINKPINS